MSFFFSSFFFFFSSFSGWNRAHFANSCYKKTQKQSQIFKRHRNKKYNCVGSISISPVLPRQAFEMQKKIDHCLAPKFNITKKKKKIKWGEVNKTTVPSSTW